MNLQSILLSVGLLGTILSATDAHGALTRPYARNYLSSPVKGVCSWSGSPVPCNGDWRSYNVIDTTTGCGGNRQLSVSGNGTLAYATTKNLAIKKNAPYTKGSTMEIEVQITAYHGGRLQFRVQDTNGSDDPIGSTWDTLPPLRVVSQSPAAPTAEEIKMMVEAGRTTGLEQCAQGNDKTCAQLPVPSKLCSNCKNGDITDKHFCGAVPVGCQGAGPDGNGSLKVTVELPPDLECEHCVLQWYWVTANAGTSDSDTRSPNDETRAAERFWNCADISIGTTRRLRGGGA